MTFIDRTSATRIWLADDDRPGEGNISAFIGSQDIDKNDGHATPESLAVGRWYVCVDVTSSRVRSVLPQWAEA